MSTDDLIQSVSDLAESQKTDSVVSDSQSEVGIDAVAQQLASELFPSDEKQSEAKAEPVADEVTEEEETASEQSTDDETPEVEAEAEVEEDDEPTDEDPDEYLADYDDVKNAILPIKINGEVREMKFSEIQNQLARAEAASNKSRKATQQLEELETRAAELDKRESYIGRQEEGTEIYNKIHMNNALYSEMEAKLEEMVNSNDERMVKNIPLIQYQMSKLQKDTDNLKLQDQQIRHEANQKKVEQQFKILNSKGYGDVITDQFKDYIENNVSADAVSIANFDASLIIALEKARKWDESQSKGKARKIKRANTPVTGGDGSVKQTAPKQKQESLKRIRSGRASMDEVDQGIDSLVQELMSNF